MAPDLDAADALAEQAEPVDAADRACRAATRIAAARGVGEVEPGEREQVARRSRRDRRRGGAPADTAPRPQPGPLPSTSGSSNAVASRPAGSSTCRASASS